MGIYDRDYYRNDLPRGGFGHFSAWSITTWLIVINIGVFFLQGFLHRFNQPVIDVDSVEGSRQFLRELMHNYMDPLERWGYFSIDTAVQGGQIWRFITFQFLHSSIGHIVGNMLGLYFFGPIVEAHFGSRRYLAFYLLCGLAGAACYVVLSVAHILGTSPDAPLIGASAGVFGLLVAAAMIAPHVQVFYYFFPVTIGMLALGGILLAAYTVIAYGPNAWGQAAHLGGAGVGFLIMKNQHWLNIFADARRAPPTAPVAAAPADGWFRKTGAGTSTAEPAEM